MSITITVDTAQPRVARPRVALTAAGKDFDGPIWADTWIDPVKHALMLRPAPLYADFHASNSGPFAKLAKSDFSFAETDWIETVVNAGDGPFLSISSMGANAVSVANWGKNRGINLCYFAYTAGAENQKLLDFGFSNTGDSSVGRSFSVYLNGAINYFLDGQPVLSTHLGGAETSQAAARQYVDLTIMPYRRRELLFFTNLGRAAVILLDDIAEDESDPIMIPDQKFWFAMYGRPQIQIAKLSFPLSGFATTVPGQFGRAPVTGATLEGSWANGAPASGVTNFRVLADSGHRGASSVDAVSFKLADGVTDFTPNSTARDVKVRVDLSGDGTTTPFVYAAHGAYACDIQETDDSASFDLTGSVMADQEVRFEMADDMEGMKCTFTVADPIDIEASVAKFRVVNLRPFKVDLDGLTVLDGVNAPASVTDAPIQENQRAQIQLYSSITHRLRTYQFRETVPIDGMDLCKSSAFCAVRFVASRCGIGDEELDLDDVDFKLPLIPGDGQEDKFNFTIEEGWTGEQAMDRLKSTFAASFLVGPKLTEDGEVFWFKDPDGLPTTPDVTLYRTVEDAIADGLDPEIASDFVYGEGQYHALDIEANEVWATGYDPRAQRPVQAFGLDEASQDPTLAPEDRPDNWAGSPIAMGVIDPKITTEAAAQRCVEYLLPVVSKRRFGAEVPCGAWPWYEGDTARVPLSRWDVVRLDGIGDYRISCVSATVSVESADDAGDYSVRNCSITGILIGSGTPYGQGGRNLHEMRAIARRSSRNKVVRRPGWEKIEVAGLGTVLVLP